MHCGESCRRGWPTIRFRGRVRQEARCERISVIFDLRQCTCRMIYIASTGKNSCRYRHFLGLLKKSSPGLEGKLVGPPEPKVETIKSRDVLIANKRPKRKTIFVAQISAAVRRWTFSTLPLIVVNTSTGWAVPPMWRRPATPPPE